MDQFGTEKVCDWQVYDPPIDRLADGEWGLLKHLAFSKRRNLPLQEFSKHD
jgi:hypothetical protein